MSQDKLTVAFARRDYSPSGGAQAYMQRLARGLVDAGHVVHLLTTEDWLPNKWEFGPISFFRDSSPGGFAGEVDLSLREIERSDEKYFDVLLSFERLVRCDVYRAGDGVHRVWLDRRERFGFPPTLFQKLIRSFRSKHDQILRLEESLFANGGAGRVIANSEMVKKEIVDLYRYPADKIDIVRNGVPLQDFRFDADVREKAREWLQLKSSDVAALFVGTGWERKGLRFAIDAVEACRDRRLRLFVAGRGNPKQHKSERAHFLGELPDIRRAYAAADIFILPTIYDPFSNACLEALASGLPVITTRANGFCEIIENNVHGSIVDLPNDVASLSEALVFWSDDARRTSARSTIIQRAAQFEISRNVEQTLQILLQASSNTPS